MSEYLLQRRAKMMGQEIVEVAKKKTKIKPLSDKRKVLQKEYRAKVKAMMKENDRCAIKAPGCTIKAQGLHHIVKRTAKNLLEDSNLLRSCNSCNTAIENNDAWARKNGFVKSKFK